MVLTDLEDLDFDCLIPLFTILSQVPPHSELTFAYQSRLQTLFESFAKFMYYFIDNVSHDQTEGALLPEYVAVTVLPVFQQYIRAVSNFPLIVTPIMILHFRDFLLTLNEVAFPSKENMAIVACFVNAIRTFSTLSEVFISNQPQNFQLLCLTTVVDTACCLYARVDWAAFSGSILKDLHSFFSPLVCEISDELMERFLHKCIFKAYGDGAETACEVVEVLCSKHFIKAARHLLDLVRWLDHLVKLYVLPDGVHAKHLSGVTLRMAIVVLSAYAAIARNTQDNSDEPYQNLFRHLYFLVIRECPHLRIEFYLSCVVYMLCCVMLFGINKWQMGIKAVGVVRAWF